MSYPENPQSGSPESRPDDAAASWGGDSSEETQVVKPPPGGYPSRPSYGSSSGSSPYQPAGSQYEPPAAPSYEPASYQPVSNDPSSGSFSQPSLASGPINPDPSAYGSSESPTTYGYGAPAYSAESNSATAVFPPIGGSVPSYAPTPTGYPGQPYTPAVPVVVPPPPTAAPAPQSSRVTAGLLSAVLGILLVAGGLYLVARFGVEIGVRGVNFKDDVPQVIGAAGGALLLLVAAVLNGWSAWATIIPGLALTGLGGWAFVSLSGRRNVDKLSNWILKNHELDVWHAAGFTLTLGLVLLGASIGAAIARSAGRRNPRVSREF